jgi:hypothetical protein
MSWAFRNRGRGTFREELTEQVNRGSGTLEQIGSVRSAKADSEFT